MDFTISNFARKRMISRDIMESEVAECLRNPATQYEVNGDTIFVMRDSLCAIVWNSC